MAKCRLCGEWAGIGRDHHDNCKERSAAGVTLEQIRSTAVLRGAAGAPMTSVRLFWVIFGALWAFSLSAGLVLGFLRVLSRAIAQ